MKADRSGPGSPAAPIRIGAWHVDPRADEISAGGEVVKLEPSKMRLLLALAERPGEVVLTNELLERVWGDVVVTSASVYQGIAQLRRQLGDDSGQPAYIETVPRKGYRLIAPVSRVDAAAAEAAPASPVAAEAGAAPVPRVDAAEAVAAPVPDVPIATAPVPLPARPSPSPTARRRWLLAGTAAFAAAGAGVFAWRWLASKAPKPTLRLAVLPFADRTPGGSDAALCQGLAFDVIQGLARYPGMQVVAPESVLAAVKAGREAGDAGRRLDAGAVLDGELLQSMPTLRLAVRLLALPGSRELWSSTFEQPAAALAALPEAIAGEVAEALRLPPPARSAEPRGPSQAYELYILGNHAWRPKTQEAFQQARGYYQRGIEIDPGFGRNYIGLGWTWIGQATSGAGLGWNEGFARAAPLFDKALRLEPDLPEALTAEAVLRTSAHEYDRARTLLDRAAALSPGYAQVHHSRGVVEFEDGWPDRAVTHFRRAWELNPLSASPIERLGLALVMSGRPADADATYRRAIAVEPMFPNGSWGLGVAAYAVGDLAGAVSGHREALRIEPRRAYYWADLSLLYLDLAAPAAAADAMARTIALLPQAHWPRIRAAWAWLIRSDRDSLPAALAPTAAAVPEDRDAIELMLIRAMAGLDIDETLLRRGVDIAEGISPGAEPLLWHVFLGHDWQIDLASLYAVLGRADEAERWLARAEPRLARLERQGNVFHALSFHRARILALRGRRAEAQAALDAAVTAGCRRGWRLRLDPAFASLRGQPAFVATLARLDAEVGRQRQRLGL